MTTESEELRNIKNRFVQSLPNRMMDIDAAIATVKSGQVSVSADAFKVLSSSAHQLSGTAGSVGFHEISDRARDLSQQIKLYSDSTGADFAEESLSGVIESWQKLSDEISRCVSESTLAR